MGGPDNVHVGSQAPSSSFSNLPPFSFGGLEGAGGRPGRKQGGMEDRARDDEEVERDMR
jgi:hypothetical protein